MGHFGGNAQIKESAELALYTPNVVCKESLRKQIFKYVKIMGFLAIASISRLKIKGNITVATIFFLFFLLQIISWPSYSLQKAFFLDQKLKDM